MSRSKQNSLMQFARGLSPDAAEKIGLGIAAGVQEVLPQLAKHLAKEMGKKTVPVRDLWKMAGMGESHFYKLVREGRGPQTIREGATHVVTMDEADRWLQELSSSR